MMQAFSCSQIKKGLGYYSEESYPCQQLYMHFPPIAQGALYIVLVLSMSAKCMSSCMYYSPFLSAR